MNSLIVTYMRVQMGFPTGVWAKRVRHQCGQPSVNLRQVSAQVND